MSSSPSRLSVLLLSAALLLSGRAGPLEPARVIAVQVQGKVGVARGPSTVLEELEENGVLSAGDTVETGPESLVVLVLPNGSTIALQPRSQLAITQVRQAPFTVPDLVVFDNLKPEPSASLSALELKFGEVVAQVRQLLPDSGFSLKTPVGTAGTAGGAFAVAYAENEERAAVLLLGNSKGLVRFTPADGQPVEVARHRQAEVRAHVSRDTVSVRQVQIRMLGDDAVDRIETLNRTAREDVNQVLQRTRAMRSAPTPSRDRPVRPGPPRNPTLDRRPEPPARPARPAGN